LYTSPLLPSSPISFSDVFSSFLAVTSSFPPSSLSLSLSVSLSHMIGEDY
jgi:hypothetical protein